MSILLTHGYLLEEDPVGREIRKPFPPLELLWASAYLKENGIDNTVYDATFSSFNMLHNYILRKKPTFLGLLVDAVTSPTAINLISKITNHRSLKGTYIIVFGSGTEYNGEAFIKNGADMAIVGAIEKPLLELVKLMGNGASPYLDHIEGLIFKNAKGSITHNKEREQIQDVNTFPLPNRKAINLKKYLSTWQIHHGYKPISIVTMRENLKTKFSDHLGDQEDQRRKPENVKEELAWLKQTYKSEHFWFVDKMFTPSKEWMQDFLKGLKDQKLKISFECHTRIDQLNEEMLQLLKACGCSRIWMGLEHGLKSFIEKAKWLGISVGVTIPIGNPEEQDKDITAKVEELKQINPDQFSLNLAYPSVGMDLCKDQLNQIYRSQYYKHAVSWIINEMYYHFKQHGNLIPGFEAMNYKISSFLARKNMEAYKNK